MKKILTFLLMAMIVSVAAHAESFTKAATKVTQNMVTAEVHDIRGTGGSNQAPYVEFTNNSGHTVNVEWIVYYGDKKVDSKTTKLSGKTRKEVFNSIDAMWDKSKKKLFTVSIRVTYPSGGYDDNM